jgi:hypothetical protein
MSVNSATKESKEKEEMNHVAPLLRSQHRIPSWGCPPGLDRSVVFLGILTNGKVTGDKVGPHDDLLDEFPYLGPPHNVL